MWLNMDMFRITLKDIMMAYLEGYFWICKDVLGYLFKISFMDMSKRDILNLQRYL
jgi:hypothetical protein